MIRVHASNKRPMFGAYAGRSYKPKRAWSVWQDGNRLPYMVVEHRTGMTIIDHSGQMVTVWHAGIGPGNLARIVLPRLGVR